MLRPVGLLVMVLTWPGSAAARCPPAQDAAVIAQGGALVTGRIVAVAPPSQARLEVATVHAGAAPAVVRLLGLPSAKLTQVDTLLRTLAHFGGFFVLGALAYSAARLTWPGVGRIGLYVFLACGAMAMLDEVKKVFIPGRHLSWSEAGLNALGALCGVLVVWGIFRLAGRCKAKAR